MHRSLGNITLNPSVGLLFVRFDGTSLRIRLTGKAEIIDDPAQFANLPGALRLVRVTADYIYYNCPRSVPKMEMVEPSKYLPRADYIRPTRNGKAATTSRPRWRSERASPLSAVIAMTAVVEWRALPYSAAAVTGSPS